MIRCSGFVGAADHDLPPSAPTMTGVEGSHGLDSQVIFPLEIWMQIIAYLDPDVAGYRRALLGLSLRSSSLATLCQPKLYRRLRYSTSDLQVSKLENICDLFEQRPEAQHWTSVFMPVGAYLTTVTPRFVAVFQRILPLMLGIKTLGLLKMITTFGMYEEIGQTDRLEEIQWIDRHDSDEPWSSRMRLPLVPSCLRLKRLEIRQTGPIKLVDAEFGALVDFMIPSHDSCGSLESLVLTDEIFANWLYNSLVTPGLSGSKFRGIQHLTLPEPFNRDELAFFSFLGVCPNLRTLAFSQDETPGGVTMNGGRDLSLVPLLREIRGPIWLVTLFVNERPIETLEVMCADTANLSPELDRTVLKRFLGGSRPLLNLTLSNVAWEVSWLWNMGYYFPDLRNIDVRFHWRSRMAVSYFQVYRQTHDYTPLRKGFSRHF